LLVRIGLYVDNSAIRLAPIAIIVVVLLAPLIVLGIAALTGAFSHHTTATRRDVLIWWCISAAIGGILPIPLGTLPRTVVFPALFFSVFWTALVAFWLSLAAAYAVQRRRRRTKPDTCHPAWLLGVSAFGNLGGLGCFLLPVLAVTLFRREELASGAAG
jgi:hypothetical protein